MNELVKDKIRTFYERMNFELRSLERFKKREGICVMGISCMSNIVPGTRGCALHLRREKLRHEGHEVARIGRYQTEYGKLRKREIPLERDQKEFGRQVRTMRDKTPRKAARRAA